MKHVTETPEAYYHRSAGGVVVTGLSDDASVAVLHRTDGEWTLPKGHLEDDETPEKAAVREIAEEIGVQRLEIVSELHTVRYTFQEAGSRKPHHKEVVFYLAVSPMGNVPLRPEKGPKFDDARWVSFPEARRLCTYANFREVLRRAQDTLHRLPRRQNT